ncbi:MAG TPA: carboxypeptidase-like regulatory domain-containing protein [Armatimonadota bacterium]|jgi:hypothetical protein
MRIVFAAIAAFLLPAAAAPLTGVVIDASGRPVAGAVVGDWLKGGPFMATDADGRYSLDIPGEKRVAAAWKPGSAMAGPRWIDARSRAEAADFTLFDAGPEVHFPVASRRPNGVRLALAETDSVDDPSAGPSVRQVEVTWNRPPAAWHVEMTIAVTDEHGGSPRLETRTYYRSGGDPAHDSGNGAAADGRMVSVARVATVTGVKSLSVVLDSAEADLAPVSVRAFGPEDAGPADAVAAMRIAAGLREPPSDPDARFRWNAYNPEAAKDPTIDARDAIALLTNREVRPLRVLVINYEPFVSANGRKLLRQVTGWRDPHPNTDEHVRDMQLASHGFLRIQRLPEIEAREFPLIFNRNDGSPFQYTEETFLKAWRTGSWLNGDWGSDYNDIIRRYDLVRRVDCGDVDEVWLEAPLGTSMWETTMAGPNAYWCNSSPPSSPKDSLNGTNGTRLFVITAFNYEREADVMIHDWGHRAESILGEKVYGRWNMNNNAAPPVTTWDRFTRIAKYFPGHASVGYCHYPANAVKDYDYANPTMVSSDADDWYNYPNFTGARKMVNKDTWAQPRSMPTGVPDYQRNYLIWMFSHMPHIPGRGPDGKLANWWKYVTDMNGYPESR